MRSWRWSGQGRLPLSWAAEGVIRAGVVADLEAVVALERKTATAPHWTDEEYARAAGQAGKTPAGLGRCLLIAEEDGVLAGFAVAALAGDEAELESVVVAAEARGRGVGEKLVKAALGWARAAGAKAMMLEVRAGSAGARRLYGRCGFVEVGVRPGYYPGLSSGEGLGPGEDAVVMRCEMGARVADV